MTPSRPPVRPRPLRRATLLAVLLAGGLVRAAESGTPASAAAGHGAPAEPAPQATPAPVITPAPSTTIVIDAAEEARGLLALGTSLTDRGDHDAAEIAYRRILGSDAFSEDDQKTGLLGMARNHRRAGAFIKATAIYEKFLKDYPDDPRVPEILLDLGRTLRAMGAHRLAISRFYSVINSTLKLPGDGLDQYQLLAKTAQFEIAETHFESGDFLEAGKFFERVRLLELAPADRARAHFKAAAALGLAGRTEDALAQLRAYVEQWPGDENVPEARYLLAVSLRKLNRTDEALAATLDLLRAEHDRNDPRRWSYWQRRTGNQLANEFFQQGDIRTALAIYEGLAALSDDPAWRLPNTYQTALCLERLGQPDQARTGYQSIVDRLAETASGPAGHDLADLGRMAAWRLAHMDWSDDTNRQLNVFFTTGPAVKTAALPVPTAALPPSDGSPAPTPATVP
jgi:tetratricopeptide (TPR) repeat protein